MRHVMMRDVGNVVDVFQVYVVRRVSQSTLTAVRVNGRDRCSVRLTVLGPSDVEDIPNVDRVTVDVMHHCGSGVVGGSVRAVGGRAVDDGPRGNGTDAGRVH